MKRKVWKEENKRVKKRNDLFYRRGNERLFFAHIIVNIKISNFYTEMYKNTIFEMISHLLYLTTKKKEKQEIKRKLSIISNEHDPSKGYHMIDIEIKGQHRFI